MLQGNYPWRQGRSTCPTCPTCAWENSLMLQGGCAFQSFLCPKVWLSMAPWVNRPSIPLSQNSLSFMGSFSQLRIQSLGISRRGLPDSTKVRVVSRLSAAITLSWALVKDHWSDELGSSTALFSPVYNDSMIMHNYHNYIPWQHADLNIQRAFKHLSQYSQLEADWGLAALCLAP